MQRTTPAPAAGPLRIAPRFAASGASFQLAGLALSALRMALLALSLPRWLALLQGRPLPQRTGPGAAVSARAASLPRLKALSLLPGWLLPAPAQTWQVFTGESTDRQARGPSAQVVLLRLPFFPLNQT